MVNEFLFEVLQGSKHAVPHFYCPFLQIFPSFVGLQEKKGSLQGFCGFLSENMLL